MLEILVLSIDHFNLRSTNLFPTFIVETHTQTHTHTHTDTHTDIYIYMHVFIDHLAECVLM